VAPPRSLFSLCPRWAFTVVGIDRLSLQTAPENVASQRVAERAGFTREGLLRAWMPTPGGRRHSVMFSLLAIDTTPEDSRPRPSDP
jgi:RimJ/RimL family protein N-acetyltransferase